jgi:hypothetical protein
VFITLLMELALASCGGTSTSRTPPSSQMAYVFTVDTDTPSLPSVGSCPLMVTGVTIFNGTTNVLVLTTPQVIDFAQFNVLKQLLDLNAVPPGTYS